MTGHRRSDVLFSGNVSLRLACTPLLHTKTRLPRTRDQSLNIETTLHFFFDVSSVGKPATAVLLHVADERARVGANRHRHQRVPVEQSQSCGACTPGEERKWRAAYQREHPHGELVKSSLHLNARERGGARVNEY